MHIWQHREEPSVQILHLDCREKRQGSNFFGWQSAYLTKGAHFPPFITFLTRSTFSWKSLTYYSWAWASRPDEAFDPIKKPGMQLIQASC
jgi:hypothetical protein